MPRIVTLCFKWLFEPLSMAGEGVKGGEPLTPLFPFPIDWTVRDKTLFPL